MDDMIYCADFKDCPQNKACARADWGASQKLLKHFYSLSEYISNCPWFSCAHSWCLTGEQIRGLDVYICADCGKRELF